MQTKSDSAFANYFDACSIRLFVFELEARMGQTAGQTDGRMEIFPGPQNY